MLVRCPNCHTTYRVADNLVTTPNPTFRCSRCKHIFVLALKPEASPARESAIPSYARHQAEEEQPELNFPFSSPEKNEGKEGGEVPFSLDEPKEITGVESQTRGQAEPETQEPSFFPEDGFRFEVDEQPPSVERKQEPAWSQGDEGPTVPETGGKEEHWEETPPELESEAPFTMPQEEPAPSTDPASESRYDFEEEWQDSPAQIAESETSSASYEDQDRPASTVPYLSLFGALLIIFSLVMLAHQAQPGRIESWIKTIPWIGPALFANDHLRHGIILQSLRPGFQKISGNREVFVISGVAVNRNPVSVREVKVEGYSYNAGGKEIERQTISLGNAISSKIIRDLTAQEISILQRLSPQKRFQIAPEESANFVIVFLKTSGEVKNFSYRVLSADAAS